MRRKCQECRLKKCLAVGMRPECVVPETQCAMKRKEKKAQKEKDKQQAPATLNTIDAYKSEIPELMKCDQPQHAECTVCSTLCAHLCTMRERIYSLATSTLPTYTHTHKHAYPLPIICSEHFHFLRFHCTTRFALSAR